MPEARKDNTPGVGREGWEHLPKVKGGCGPGGVVMVKPTVLGAPQREGKERDPVIKGIKKVKHTNFLNFNSNFYFYIFEC